SLFFFFQAEDGIRDFHVTGVQTCALPISSRSMRMGTSIRKAATRKWPEPQQGSRVFKSASCSGQASKVPAAGVQAPSSCFTNRRSEERRVGKEGRSRGSP